MVDLTSLRVDGDRLLWRLRELGGLGSIRGANGEPGSARLALTDADREGRDLVVAWMRELGLDVRVDTIGNVVAIRPAADGSVDRPVMTRA